MTSEEIKKLFSMKEIIERYGYTINSRGFMCCPFHQGDNTPSLRVYKTDYHCYACGANGDVINWIQEMENVDFRGAMEILHPGKISFIELQKIRRIKNENLKKIRIKQKKLAEGQEILKNIEKYRHAEYTSENVTKLYYWQYRHEVWMQEFEK